MQRNHDSNLMLLCEKEERIEMRSQFSASFAGMKRCSTAERQSYIMARKEKKQ